jgi:hypothetical protein
MVITVALIEIIYYFDILADYSEYFNMRNILIGTSCFIIVWFLTGLVILVESNDLVKQWMSYENLILTNEKILGIDESITVVFSKLRDDCKAGFKSSEQKM